MNEHRRQGRIATDMSVTVVTVLDNRAGRIVDVSAGGAQIADAAFPVGTRIQIDHEDQTFYGRVMWSEDDRMGVRFEVPVRSAGPVGEMIARAVPPREMSVTRPQLRVGFGRRIA